MVFFPRFLGYDDEMAPAHRPPRVPRGLLLALLCTLSILASPLGAADGGLRFDRLSVEDGLSHSSVWTIYQDSVGFLWLGTQEGLNRFDGYGCTV